MFLQNRICVFIVLFALVELNDCHLKLLSGIANHVATTLDRVEQKVHHSIGKLIGKNCDKNSADVRPHGFEHNHDRNINQNFGSHGIKEYSPEGNFGHGEINNQNGYESQAGILGNNNQGYEFHNSGVKPSNNIRRKPINLDDLPNQNNDVGYSSSNDYIFTRRPIRQDDTTVTDPTVGNSQNGVKIDVRFGNEE
ncbi:uncharacterized protein LOC123292254 [Chrysoperla carnea]|uniref:uncharacterized protein LOC123292254 n=1 Tax=Chrysoperla carnea TaxID=189513 RepID=UPI001D0870F9|nr:uncharacterized protein LOC123292254 [Chrysoperla carnea]